MKISSLPLPSSLISLFESQGYKELYPPQIEAIKSGVLNGANLLITSPTASGKTLIALMAAAKIVINNEGKVVYLAPLRALANEKFEEFNTLSTLQKSNGERVKVLISTGDYDSRSEYLSEGDILILTNEKFDSILRHGADWLNFVKLFVIDEIHLVDSLDRGPTIETIIAKILTYASQSQLLALSATITNAKELADWLGAKLVNVNWRPVKLIEGVYEYGKIKFIDGSIREVKPTGKGAVIDVAIDTISENGQSLIFVETRKRAMSLSLKSAEITKHYLNKDEIDKLKNLSEEILNTGEETELSRTLAKVVNNGVAFHHAGLDAQHRRIVESGFRDGLIKLLIATPTLAAGVNLPARRVVISSFMRYDSEYGGQMPISILEYKQMCLPYNTRILMGDGSTLPIGEIVEKRICGNVITYDERLRRFVQKRIIDWFSRDATQLVEIRTNNGRKLLLTPEHPIMTKNSWVPAGDLKNNDKIAYVKEFEYKVNKYHNLSDYYLKIESVEWLCVKSVKRLNGKHKVYNISVEETENYVAENFVVHNCGRAGRPQYDSIGETVLIAHSSSEADELIHHYIKGTPEPIQSRLSQGGALRTHILATISTLPGIDDTEIFELFSKTLFSRQYRKVTFHKKIKEAIEYLIDNKLIEQRVKRYIATEFGKRISLLYIDPETGVMFRDALRLVKDKVHPIGLLHLIVISQDFTPKFPLRSKDWELAISFINEFKDKFIIPIPNERDYDEYESFLSNMRSLMVMLGWIDEWSEDKLLTTYGVEPGDLHRAVESADWLLYSLSEISKLLGYTNLLNEIYELRQRVKYGIKPELIPLVSLEGIGRIRARSLYNFGFTSLEKLASASIDKIASVPKIGYALAKRIKDQISFTLEK